jgi:hypothetical protein
MGKNGTNIRKWVWGGGMVAVFLSGAVVAHETFDFGVFRDRELEDRSKKLFGVERGVAESSKLSIDAATANADPRKLVTLAKGLKAKVISAAPNLGPNIDQMVLWPNDVAPTHIIACNEEGVAQPGVQRIKLSDGSVETMITGTTSCDPVRLLPWGTVLAGEEAGTSGQMFEILDPLAVTNVLFDRVAGTFADGPGGSGADKVTVRRTLGRLSFEGLAVYPNGVIYYGDEARPGTGTAGGAYFKFIPATLFTGTGPITDLSQSPLAAGSIYGLRLGKRSGNTDYGQGTQTGKGVWVPVPSPVNADLHAFAVANKLTGYYRPEDAEVDTAALAAGKVRFWAVDTGNEGDDNNFGEVLTVTDGTLAEAGANTAVPEVQFLVMGTPELAMPDNIARQPGSGNVVLHEDGDQLKGNNDLWSCLDDGADADLLSDGCLRIASLNDLTAEWTGGFFDRSGTKLIVSVQHNITAHGVILGIEGFRNND